MTTTQEIINARAKAIQDLIGQPPEAIKSLRPPDEDTFRRLAEGFKELKEPQLTAPPNVGKTASTWYGCSCTVGGFVYSSVTTRWNFGDYGDHTFEAGFWGAFGGGAGGGGGPWADLPKDGESMEFELVMAAYTGGVTQMFWWRKGGNIIGGMDAVIGGLGVGGTKGTGKWKKN